MKVDFNRLEGLNARMTLVIEYSDYGPKLDENIKKYSKKVALKGFRSGKTPKSVLTKMYGKGMLEETVSSLLNEKLFAYLESEKINYFGSPMLAEDSSPVDFNPKSQEDYTFVFDLGLKPDFAIDYQSEEILHIQVPTIDQAALDEDMIRYRRVFGADIPVSDGKVEKHDRVGVSLQKINKDGSLEESVTETTIDLDRIQGEANHELMDLSAGASLDADLEKFLGFERSVILKNTLHVEQDPSPGEPLTYKVTINTIHRPQSTELTGEQLTKFTGKTLNDEAEFREMLEKREMDNMQARIVDMKKMSVRKTLLHANPFEVPEAFLLKWVNQQRDKKIEEGSREANTLYRDAKWSLLLNRIAIEAGLEVTEKDVQRQVTHWVIDNVNYMQTDIKKLMDRLYANEYFMSTMKENALEEVVFTDLLPKYNFETEEVSAEAFEKAFHDLHHELFDHGDHGHHDHSHHDHSHHDHTHSHEGHEHLHR